MDKNKHILVYEAFSSKALSKTLSYINKELGKSYKNTFMSTLHTVSDRFDLTFDNIDDSYFEYLGKKDALLVRNTTNVSNPEGIFCLKFWFSIDKGYLGYTYTGNITKKDVQKIQSSKLTLDELNYLGIKSGTIKTLRNFEGLKTGDMVIGYLSDYERKDRLTISKLYFEDYSSSRKKVFAIQNVAAGSAPDEREWRNYGELSWAIGNHYPHNPSDDHFDNDNFKLSSYIDDGSELNVDGVSMNAVPPTEVEVVNPKEFNLPMRDKTVKAWGESQNSVNRDAIGELDNVDFAIIFYYDDFVNKGVVKKPSLIRKDRAENKKDALSFKDDKQIKKENLERYVNGITKIFGITETAIDPKNLQKIISKTLNGEISLYNLRHGSINDTLHNLQGNIIDFIHDYESYKKSYGDRLPDNAKDRLRARYNNVVDRIRRIYLNDRYRDQKRVLSEIEKEIKNFSNPEAMKEIFDKINSIALYISDKISKMEVNSVEDLIQVRYRLSAVRNIINDDYIGIKSYLEYYVDNMPTYPSDALDYLSSLANRREDTMTKLNSLERHIKSTL